MTDPGRGPSEIPPGRIDESTDEEAQHDLEQLRDHLDVGLRAVALQIRAVGEKINTALQKLTGQVNLKPLLDQQNVYSENLVGSINKHTVEMQDLNNTTRAVYELMAKQDQEDPTDKWSRKNFRLAIFVGVITGVIGLTGLGALITAIVAAIQTSTPPPPTGDPDIDKMLKELYRCVKNTDDGEFWNQVAAFVLTPRTWTLYLADQMAMMNYVIDWFPWYGDWVWATGSDKAAYVEQLVSVYRRKGIAAVYSAVNTLTYAGDPTRSGAVPLPRAIAADVVRIALARIVAEDNGITD